MKKPKIINLFIDTYTELSQLSDAQVGRLIKAILVYADHGETPDFSDDIGVSLMFSSMKKQIDRDFKKYTDLCEKRSQAGKKGGAPLGNSNAAKTSKTSKTSEDKDNKEDNNEDEDENEDDNDNNNKHEAQSAHPDYLIPLEYISDVHEVIDYLNQVAGTHIRVTNFGNGMMLTKLFKKGYTVEDCKRVIDNECDRIIEKCGRGNLLSIFLFGMHFEEYAKRSA